MIPRDAVTNLTLPPPHKFKATVHRHLVLCSFQWLIQNSLDSFRRLEVHPASDRNLNAHTGYRTLNPSSAVCWLNSENPEVTQLDANFRIPFEQHLSDAGKYGCHPLAAFRLICPSMHRNAAHQVPSGQSSSNSYHGCSSLCSCQEVTPYPSINAIRMSNQLRPLQCETQVE